MWPQLISYGHSATVWTLLSVCAIDDGGLTDEKRSLVKTNLEDSGLVDF